MLLVTSNNVRSLVFDLAFGEREKRRRRQHERRDGVHGDVEMGSERVTRKRERRGDRLDEITPNGGRRFGHHANQRAGQVYDRNAVQNLLAKQPILVV